ncbi:hypothetical protein D3C83_272690 [compost metagenome]
MFATAGRSPLRATKSTAAMMIPFVELPLQPKTRSAKIRAPLATPKVEPPMVPAT